MIALRTLLFVLLAAAFLGGGAARAMPAAPADMPPCHEEMSGHTTAAPQEAPQETPKSQVMVMNCCLGCMPAAAPQAQVAAAAAVQTVRLVEDGPSPVKGLSPAPEPEPPRA